MADKSVPQLDPLASLSDTDLLHIVRSNLDKRITAALLKQYVLGTTTAPVVYSVTKTIPSAEVLTSNATPVLLIAAIGAGKAIVVLNSTTIKLDYNSATYAANTSCSIYTDTATKEQLLYPDLLAASVTTTRLGEYLLQGGNTTSFGATSTQLIANKGIYFKTLTGDPTTGDSDLIVNLQYLIIDI